MIYIQELLTSRKLSLIYVSFNLVATFVRRKLAYNSQVKSSNEKRIWKIDSY